jgi:hypothetical protein
MGFWFLTSDTRLLDVRSKGFGEHKFFWRTSAAWRSLPSVARATTFPHKVVLLRASGLPLVREIKFSSVAGEKRRALRRTCFFTRHSAIPSFFASVSLETRLILDEPG